MADIEVDSPLGADTDERVGVIVRDIKRNLLVVEGTSGKLSFPKGCRKVGETAWEGALREAWEETGIDLESLPHVLLVKKMQLRHGTYFLFNMNLTGHRLPLKPQEGESNTIYWAKPDDELFQAIPCNIDLATYLQIARVKSKQAAKRLTKRIGVQVDPAGAGLIRCGTQVKSIPQRPRSTIQIWMPPKGSKPSHL